MASQYPTLFSPIRFGRLELRNRLIMTGMAGHMAPPDGSVTDREIAFYERRARGGVGLAVVGAAYVHPGGRFSNDQLGIHTDAHVEGYRRLAAAIKRHGAVASIQLHHAGRQTNSRVTGERLIAPSAVACPVKQEVPHALTVEEIAEVVEWFGQGARRAISHGRRVRPGRACGPRSSRSPRPHPRASVAAPQNRRQLPTGVAALPRRSLCRRSGAATP